jgi:hypothetical protein
MKIFTIAFAVATTAALCSAQQTAVIRGHKVLLDKFGNQITPAQVNPLPGAPLVGGSDTCATPDVIVGNGPFAFDTTAATTGTEGQAESICNFFGSTAIAHDVWYTWTAATSGSTTVAVCGLSTADTKIAVYGGTGCPTSAALACNDDSCGLQSSITFTAVAGNNYVFQIGAYPFASGGTGQFAVTPPSASPANDLCSTPTVISGLGNFAVNMVGATTDGIMPTCLFSTPEDDVWYTWTAPASGNATVSLCGHTAGDDTMLGIWPGAGCPTGSSTSVACDDDFCGLTSSVTFAVTAGTVYTIQVGMFPGSAPINTSMDITMPPPANDDCNTPIVLAGPGLYPFDTSLATTGTQYATNGCGTINKDLWYTYTATTNGTATLVTCGLMDVSSTSFDTKVAAYLGAGCPGATSIACNDDLSGCPQLFGSSMTFNVTCGTVYSLRIGNFSSSATTNIHGMFSLTEAGTGCLTAPTPYCFGDGTGTACPCSNGAPGNGCSNGTTMAGANLAAAGTNSITADTLTLAGSGMPATSPALYFQGTAQVSVVFGDGLNCAGGTQVRLGTKINTAGASAYPGAGDPSISVKGGASAGSNLNYQVIYRDASSFCPTSTFNTTNGINVVWAP